MAAQKYTPLEGASFASYASIRIRGAIVDYLRKSSNLCRTTIQIKKKYNEATENLERTLMRQPDRQEIAAEMKMSEDELSEWEAAFQANTHQSIESVYDQFSVWFTSSVNNPEEELNETELHAQLKEALTTLPEREALVIQLYYVEEMNVFEIGEVLDVSTGRVSQIKKAAITHLRSYIQKGQ
jgi:RNA polymerase sigma factor for flagellar operon FliA